ncbi:hypothetical protein ACFZB9_25750 [Kitasatospora sp. NPDC008050]|uniref:hypothetical protein n=1 Tax=Kitasatospora sp. NPDC008050 TaxID=3364021 RepID=UPI0036E91309
MEQITSTTLARQPNLPPAEAYARLAAAHGPIEWCEAVGARMPRPDERAALHVPEGVPVLISQCITQTQADTRRLMLETTTMGAGSAHLAFTYGPAATKRR